VLAELHTGYVLFQSDSLATMLARIVGVMGVIPEYVLVEGKDAPNFFTAGGEIYEQAEDGSYSLIYPKRTSLKARLHLQGSAGDEEAKGFLDFIAALLDLDWRRRPTATEALQHPWLKGAYENDVYYEAA
jgi:hypothetical protein